MATIDAAVLEGGIAGAKPNVKMPKISSVPNAATLGKGALRLGISGTLGFPALAYDMLNEGPAGGPDMTTGFDPIEKYGPEYFDLDYDEPIPELGGWTYEEAINSPEWRAFAEEHYARKKPWYMTDDEWSARTREEKLDPGFWNFSERARDKVRTMKGWDLEDMRVRDFVNEILYHSIIAPEKGPAQPGAFDMETLEEYYGDTPWFQEYKKDIPLGHQAQRSYSNTIQSVVKPVSNIGWGIGHLIKKHAENAGQSGGNWPLLGP